MGVNKVVYGTTTIIDISDSTVTKDKMLKDAVAYGANGDKVTGNIETKTSDDITFDFTHGSEKANLPAGYYATAIRKTIPTESRYVTPDKDGRTVYPSEGKLLNAVQLAPIPKNYADTSSGDALASDMLKGKKAWVDGNEVTGNIETYDGAPIAGSVYDSRNTYAYIRGLMPDSLKPGAMYVDDGIVNMKVTLADFGDAVADNVLEGNTFTSGAGVMVEGRMQDVTAAVKTYSVLVDELETIIDHLPDA